MKYLVIYDSYFNNTRQIATSIARAIPEASLKAAKEVSINEFLGYNLVIMGSPTRSFRPTENISKLLKSLPSNALTHCKIAAFDTRIDLETINAKFWRKVVHAGGYAAPTILKMLCKKGATPLVEPEGFYVLDTEGPLKDNEIERAFAWGVSIFDKSNGGE